MLIIIQILTMMLATTLIFSSCSKSESQPTEMIIESVVIAESVSPVIKTGSSGTREPTTSPIEEKFSYEEVNVIAKTLAGECYDDKLNDKRKVVEVILNRVSDGRFGDSVIAVVEAKGQFAGYWRQSRPVSDSDIQIAEEALREWYSNDCKSLSEYLFFCAGPNRENKFRTKY